MTAVPSAIFPDYKLASVASLIPYARNARTHSDAQVAQIAASHSRVRLYKPGAGRWRSRRYSRPRSPACRAQAGHGGRAHDRTEPSQPRPSAAPTC